jgi:hypothetical protein
LEKDPMIASSLYFPTLAHLNGDVVIWVSKSALKFKKTGWIASARDTLRRDYLSFRAERLASVFEKIYLSGHLIL